MDYIEAKAIIEEYVDNIIKDEVTAPIVEMFLQLRYLEALNDGQDEIHKAIRRVMAETSNHQKKM
jgi:hypothetical protein